MLGFTRGPLSLLTLILAASALPAAAEAQDAPDYGPDVLVISDPVLAALAKGLRTEIALRAALKKEIEARDASEKTPEQYRECYGQAVMSPEAMEVAEGIMTIPENATMGQRQRRMERVGKRLEAVVFKKCGPEPRPYSRDTWLAERLREIELRAADAAGPLP